MSEATIQILTLIFLFIFGYAISSLAYSMTYPEHKWKMWAILCSVFIIGYIMGVT